MKYSEYNFRSLYSQCQDYISVMEAFKDEDLPEEIWNLIEEQAEKAFNSDEHLRIANNDTKIIFQWQNETIVVNKITEEQTND